MLCLFFSFLFFADFFLFFFDGERLENQLYGDKKVSLHNLFNVICFKKYVNGSQREWVLIDAGFVFVIVLQSEVLPFPRYECLL